MIEKVSRAIAEANSKEPKVLAVIAIEAMLSFIKEAMEYHGVQGAMNKQIVKRIEDQLK